MPQGSVRPERLCNLASGLIGGPGRVLLNGPGPASDRIFFKRVREQTAQAASEHRPYPVHMFSTVPSKVPVLGRNLEKLWFHWTEFETEMKQALGVHQSRERNRS